MVKHSHIGHLITNHLVAIVEITKQGLVTMTPFKPEKKLPRIRKARAPSAALRPITGFLSHKPGTGRRDTAPEAGVHSVGD